MYLYPITHIVTGDIIPVPVPNYGAYDIIIGFDPSQNPQPYHDNFHWRLALYKDDKTLSSRSMLLQIDHLGNVMFKNISNSNTHIIGLPNRQEGLALKPGDVIHVKKKDYANLRFQVNCRHLFSVQSVSGGTGYPDLFISSLRRES